MPSRKSDIETIFRHFNQKIYFRGLLAAAQALNHTNTFYWVASDGWGKQSQVTKESVLVFIGYPSWYYYLLTIPMLKFSLGIVLYQKFCPGGDYTILSIVDN